MTKITLGVGEDAVDVEDGSSVPLRADRMFKGRATVHWAPSLSAAMIRLCHEDFKATLWTIDRATGAISDHPISTAIDLPALRRELAPKPTAVGGWTLGSFTLPGLSGHYETVTLYRRDPKSDAQLYWTHRPGNTPERQAAFDEAVAAWLYRYGPHNTSSVPEHQALIDAALALGYPALALGYPARAAPCA